jgi:hypothetical protein
LPLPAADEIRLLGRHPVRLGVEAAPDEQQQMAVGDPHDAQELAVLGGMAAGLEVLVALGRER